MSTIGMRVDISALVDALIAGDNSKVITIARDLLRQGAHADELIGRIGMIAAHGDPEGHRIITLTATGIISRWLLALPLLPEQNALNHERELPLLVQALLVAAPAVRVGRNAKENYPKPLFPSELSEGATVNAKIHEAIFDNNPELVERLLFGLYGTGADYRTMQVRVYDGIATTFQKEGHSLLFAIRGLQLLDLVEWGDRVPNILHWVTPHLPLQSEEPDWINQVRMYLAEPDHNLESLRTRLSPPKNENALPLRKLILSNASTLQVCQGVYEALIKNGASTRGVGSVIALAATDLLQNIGDDKRDAFVSASHGLLVASAIRQVFFQVQDIAATPLLFTAAAFINALQQQLASTNTSSVTGATATTIGGGLIAPTLLEALNEHLNVQDLNGAFATARRYLKLGYDAQALFATIGLAAAQADATEDQGHTLQIVQAAGEAFLTWPSSLAETSIDIYLHTALRAVVFAKRNTLVASL